MLLKSGMDGYSVNKVDPETNRESVPRLILVPVSEGLVPRIELFTT
jgi:hypothetical protein